MSGDPQPRPRVSEADRRKVRQAAERTAAKLPSERDLAAADSAWAEFWGAAVVPSEAARQILARSLAQARAEGRAAGWLAGCEGVLKEVAQARAEEREACAEVCEAIYCTDSPGPLFSGGVAQAAEWCAAAIRRRGDRP